MNKTTRLLTSIFLTIVIVGFSFAISAQKPQTAEAKAASPYIGVVRHAILEYRKGVRERRGDNIPRYPNNRVAPYNIGGNEWCVAFATAMWARAGFTAYRGADNLMQSSGGNIVAVQTQSLIRWARLTGRFRSTALPGYAVVYRNGSGGHTGLVTKTNSAGVAIKSIEGNYLNAVKVRRPPRSQIAGYISPS
jgi:hypothetical protein